jgi:UDP-N-acetylglucosamine 1-carboxyvinyltransferase
LASFVIYGGKPLQGHLRVQGAKNAALPALAASILAPGKHRLQDVPHLVDTGVMLKILASLGARTHHEQNVVTLDTSEVSNTVIPEMLMERMRSSIFLLGPLLARFKEVTITRPGGCAIGERPIDLHLAGLRALGADIIEKHGKIYCHVQKLHGARIHLHYPSVGATENIMMAATLAEGETQITNPAREPEISDLAHMLQKMGAHIKGAGTDCITIEGVSQLYPVEHRIIPDRILAGTILVAAAMTGGAVELCNVRPDHLASVLSILELSGVEIQSSHDIIRLRSNGRPQAVGPIYTAPYPGFPTDMQAQMMTYLSIAQDTSILKETVFEGRFKHVDELNRMGAHIRVDLNTAFIRGVSELYGAAVEATDLRAGAALVIAGLRAQGVTTVECIEHIDRGYERFELLLECLGAQIERTEEQSLRA